MVAEPIAAYGIGPVNAPLLAAVPQPGNGAAGILDFTNIPRAFWDSSAFGLLLLIVAFAYVTGRLLKG